MGPHFRARPRAEPRQPARCRRRRSVTGAPYVRASVFVVDSPCGTREKEKRRKRSLGVRVGFVGSVVSSSSSLSFERTRERVTELRSKIAFHAARALRR